MLKLFELTPRRIEWGYKRVRKRQHTQKRKKKKKFSSVLWVWGGDWLYKKGQKKYSNKSKRRFFLFFFPLAWRRATTSVAYLSRHSPRRDNHNFLTYFFSFAFAFIGKCEKREAQSRRTMRPSWGRWASKRERESLTRRNAQFSTPNRHRRWSSISSCRLEILGGKRARPSLFFFSFSIASSSFPWTSQSSRKAHPSDYHKIVRSCGAGRRTLLLCAKKYETEEASSSSSRGDTKRRWRCARTSRGHLHTTFDWADLFLNTRAQQSGNSR